MNRLEKYDVFDIPLSEIVVDDDFNCRSWFTGESTESLMASIEERGLDYPVTCNQDKHLVTGFRRYKAYKLLGLTSIPSFIRNLTAHEAALLNVRENLERENLNILEEARALGHLYPDRRTDKHPGMLAMSKEIGRNVSWVHIRWRLLAQPEEIQQKAAAGLLNESDLKLICKKENNEEDRLRLCKEIVESKQAGKKVFRRKAMRSKEQISRMQIEMLVTGISGLAVEALSWCAGDIADSDLLDTIKKTARHKIRSIPHGRK